MQAPPTDNQLARSHGQRRGQVALRRPLCLPIRVGRGVCGSGGSQVVARHGDLPQVRARRARQRGLPRVDVQTPQANIGGHATRGCHHGLAGRKAQGDAAALNLRQGATCVALELDRANVAELDVQLIPPRRQHPVVIAQGHRAVGGFAQRRRQIQRQPPQVALHVDIQSVGTNGEQGLVGGGTLRRCGKARKKPQLGSAAQALGTGLALRTKNQGGIGRRGSHPRGRPQGRAIAAIDPRFPTVEARAGVAQRKARLGDGDLAPRSQQQRAVGCDAQVVAWQIQCRLDAAAVQLRQGQLQAQLQLGRAIGHGVVERTVHQLGDRRVAHSRQHVGRRAPQFGSHRDHGGAQVGDACVRL